MDGRNSYRSNLRQANSNAASSPKELRNKRESEIRSLEKELNHSTEQKETNRGLNRASKGEQAIPKKLRENTNSEIVNLRDKLVVEKYTKKALDDMEKNGVPMQKARYSIFLDQMLPAPANKLLDK